MYCLAFQILLVVYLLLLLLTIRFIFRMLHLAWYWFIYLCGCVLFKFLRWDRWYLDARLKKWKKCLVLWTKVRALWFFACFGCNWTRNFDLLYMLIWKMWLQPFFFHSWVHFLFMIVWPLIMHAEIAAALTYRAYDAVDEITAAISLAFNPAGTKWEHSFWKVYQLFN